MHGDVGYLQIREEALENADVLGMMQRLSFVVDPEMDAQFPQKRLAWVEITLKDGRLLRSAVFAAPGEHTDHVDLDWICKKFMRITKPVLEEKKQREIVERKERADRIKEMEGRKAAQAKSKEPKKEKEEFFLYKTVDVVINIISSTLKNYTG